MNIGLLFGSFNPIHTGHIKIARYMLKYVPLQEVWLVVSPHNPFKTESELTPAKHRLEMAHLAVRKEKNINVSDIEFTMLKPSYTFNTLNRIIADHPQHSFSLIIGEDNLPGFKNWRQHRKILEWVRVYIYPRKTGKKTEGIEHHNMIMVKGPLLKHSATEIRSSIMKRKKYSGVPPEVRKYITTHGLFR